MPGSLLIKIAFTYSYTYHQRFIYSGINLALTNIGIKLAPKNEAMVYITSKNMLVAFSSTIAPVIGGLMADFFATHQIAWNMRLKSSNGVENLRLLDLQGWNYFFIICGLLAILSLRLLSKVKEHGEIRKRKVVNYMRTSIRNKFRKNPGRKVTSHIYAPSVAESEI